MIFGGPTTHERRQTGFQHAGYWAVGKKGEDKKEEAGRGEERRKGEEKKEEEKRREEERMDNEFLKRPKILFLIIMHYCTVHLHHLLAYICLHIFTPSMPALSDANDAI